MDWIEVLYATGVAVIAIALAVIGTCVFFILDQKPVRYESFPEVAEVAFREEEFCLLLFEGRKYPLHDKRIVVLNKGDEVGVRVNDSYNWRGKSLERWLTLDDPELL